MNNINKETEMEKILIDSFQPYAGMIKENQEAVSECYEVINRPLITGYCNTMIGTATVSIVL